MTAKQAERLTKELRGYLDTIRDAAIRCRGKTEVTRQCDTETQQQVDLLNRLFETMNAIVEKSDLGLGILPALESLLGEKKGGRAVAGKVG